MYVPNEYLQNEAAAARGWNRADQAPAYPPEHEASRMGVNAPSSAPVQVSHLAPSSTQARCFVRLAVPFSLLSSVYAVRLAAVLAAPSCIHRNSVAMFCCLQHSTDTLYLNSADGGAQIELHGEEAS